MTSPQILKDRVKQLKREIYEAEHTLGKLNQDQQRLTQAIISRQGAIIELEKLLQEAEANERVAGRGDKGKVKET